MLEENPPLTQTKFDGLQDRDDALLAVERVEEELLSTKVECGIGEDRVEAFLAVEQVEESVAPMEMVFDNIVGEDALAIVELAKETCCPNWESQAGNISIADISFLRRSENIGPVPSPARSILSYSHVSVYYENVYPTVVGCLSETDWQQRPFEPGIWGVFLGSVLPNLPMSSTFIPSGKPKLIFPILIRDHRRAYPMQKLLPTPGSTTFFPGVSLVLSVTLVCRGDEGWEVPANRSQFAASKYCDESRLVNPAT
ncbi:hypothetical protein BT96DRAFT_984514 [Gymnopus androsaceus JB14]|uniref:Uncharacterized protein n=1 Tax=Gymnopus androsaceus JB14 TaxID=1447944 RepID=A0A6A4IBC7_9AGAR|nr:hypothetical protein BT96DRAFT_984514 [Gymnopus androsaceus JB14]